MECEICSILTNLGTEHSHKKKNVNFLFFLVRCSRSVNCLTTRSQNITFPKTWAIRIDLFKDIRVNGKFQNRIETVFRYIFFLLSSFFDFIRFHIFTGFLHISDNIISLFYSQSNIFRPPKYYLSFLSVSIVSSSVIFVHLLWMPSQDYLRQWGRI